MAVKRISCPYTNHGRAETTSPGIGEIVEIGIDVVVVVVHSGGGGDMSTMRG